MRQFNLEAALAGDQVTTRDGRRVTQIMLFKAERELWPVVGVVDDLVHLFSLAGKSGEDHTAMPYDLFMAEPANESRRRASVA